jgi:enoyl-CoA hydratase/carnithine racemase
MDGLIQVTIEHGVADVRLARAHKLNALDNGMFAALVETGERLKRDASLRAVVLSGEGRAFCAGLDLDLFQGMADGTGVDIGGAPIVPRVFGDANGPQHAVLVWREVPVPVITAIQGVAFGAGFQLALGADIRLATPGTRFSAMEVKWGRVPDLGGFLLMRHLVRDDRMRELIYTGRIFSAAEAHAYGLVTDVTDNARQAALDLARELAGRNPDALRAAKRLANLASRADAGKILLAESMEQAKLIGSRNQAEAVNATRENRAPSFLDLAD